MSKRPSFEQEDGDRFRFFKKRRADDDDLPELYFVFQGEVASIQTYGAFIKIPGFKKQGLVHKSQMSKARVDDPSEMLSVGEVVHCKVISTDDNKISLSMKMVNQTTGQDEDPTNVQLSLDERKKKQGFRQERPRIELGAVLDTTCRKCGGHGHLAQDCFHSKGGKAYELVPDIDLSSVPQEENTDSAAHRKKKKKKEKKAKKSKKHRKHHSSSSGSEDDDKMHKKRSKHKHKNGKKKKHHRHSSSSD